METLRFHLQRPLHKRRDMSGAPCAGVAKQVRYHVDTRFKHDQRKPEVEAIRFYLLNHAMADLRQMYDLDEPLPASALPLVNAYYEELNDLAVRMFSYLILITTRESRHGSTPSTLFQKIEKKFGAGAKAFNLKIKGDDELAAIEKWKTTPPENCTIGQYVDMMAWIFYAEESGFHGGFGGAKWGVIADLVCDFVHGRINAEMMLDTGFTLAHNGGPIFNKGMCFTSYNLSMLMKVLDVQASGQVPMLIPENGLYGLGSCCPPQIVTLWKKAQEAVGTYTEPVDWWVVEATAKGAENYNLAGLKKIQQSEHGMSEKAAEVEKIKAAAAAKAKAEAEAKAEAKQALALAQAAKAKAAKETEMEKWYQFGPGDMKVKKATLLRPEENK